MANQIRNRLIANTPVHIDRNLINSINFKKTHNVIDGPVAYSYGKENFIVVDSIRNWSDFMYLRALSKLHQGYLQTYNNTLVNVCALASGLSAAYFFKKPNISRGITTVLMPILSTIPVQAAFIPVFNKNARQANQDAIDVSKNEQQLISAKSEISFMGEMHNKVIYRNLIEPFSVSYDIFFNIKNGIERYAYYVVGNPIMCHMHRCSEIMSKEDNLEAINTALKKLEDQERLS